MIHNGEVFNKQPKCSHELSHDHVKHKAIYMTINKNLYFIVGSSSGHYHFTANDGDDDECELNLRQILLVNEIAITNIEI